MGFLVSFAYSHESQVKGGKSSINWRPVMAPAQMSEHIALAGMCPNFLWSMRMSADSTEVSATRACLTLNKPFMPAGIHPMIGPLLPFQMLQVLFANWTMYPALTIWLMDTIVRPRSGACKAS